MDLEKLDRIKVNFIIGPGRSGTTLLMNVLNQSKHAVATPEIKHLLFFYRKYKNVSVVSRELISDLNKYLTRAKTSRPIALASPGETSLLDLLIPGELITYSRLSKLFYLSLISDKNDMDSISCIVDKNPYYTFYTAQILEIFPDAKFVVMIRDYRAFILSNRQNQKPFVKIHSIFYYAEVWNLYVNKILSLQKKLGNRIILVKYEEMTENKEKIVEDIVAFLGVEYSPSMMDFHKSITEKLQKKNINLLDYNSGAKKIRDLSSPVNTDRVSAWKTELLPVEIKKADFACSHTGPAMGYQPCTETSSYNLFKYRLTSLPAKLRVMGFKIFDSPIIDHYKSLLQFKKNKDLFKGTIK